MNNFKQKTKKKQNETVKKSKHDKIRFVVSREYRGTSSFSELFEPIVEVMVRNDINQQMSGVSEF